MRKNGTLSFIKGGGKLLHSLGFGVLTNCSMVQFIAPRIKKSHHKHNFSFVIANECEAISNKLKDCHVAIAPRNDVTVWRNSAFTLAEILITLAIIGVVSAMTIPTIITKHQKMIIEKRITQDYSIIQQVLRMHVIDGLDMSTESARESTTYQQEWYNKYWAPYLKTAKVCINSAGCWQNKGANKALSGDSVWYNNGARGIGASVITVRLQNGTSLCIDGVNPSDTSTYLGVTTAYYNTAMYVDANGDSPPNTIGKDIYVFVYTKETGLVPAGYSMTPEQIRANCSKNATGMFAGYYCLSRVKLDGWKILDEVWNANN